MLHEIDSMAGLGRGLGSLIPQKTTPLAQPVELTKTTDFSASNSVQDNGERVLELEVGLLEANKHQPRTDFAEGALQDLADSIREHGILQPVIVVKKGSGYELVAGERRLRAAKLAGLKTIPAIVRDFSEQKKMELALIENIQRENLNPMEIAHSLKKLLDEFNLSQESLAKRVGKSRSGIANTLRLLSLPSEIQRALAGGSITEGHAKILLGIESPVKQLVMYKKIMANKMTVADTATETRKIGGTKQARNKNTSDISEKEAAFREFFGAKAEIKQGKKGGQVILTFYSFEELEWMIKKLGK